MKNGDHDKASERRCDESDAATRRADSECDAEKDAATAPLASVEGHGSGLGQAGSVDSEGGIAENQGGGINGAIGGGQSGQGGG